MAGISQTGKAPASERSPLRGAAREHAILDATLELIGEVGYERITVDSIAARAHASKTTMYRRWPGKAELVADALRRRAQGDIPAIPDSGSLRTDLLLTVRQIAETLTGRSGPSLIGLLEAVRDDTTLRELIGSQIRQQSHDVGRAICAHAAARGEALRSDRSDTVIDVAFARVFTDTLFDACPPDATAREHLVDEVLLPLLYA
jgi:AcrR family transcriptional regulator